jgi:hypothetical protein
MSHRSAVTFDTVCLILFVSCVLSFRLSLRLFYVFLLFLISTSRHNTTNFLSHIATASTTAAAAATTTTTTPTIALKFHPKHEKRKQKR